jgi:uncharacterized protein with FMN-binding domain
MKRWIKILLSIVAIIVILTSIFIFFLYYGKSETLNLTINAVDLSKLSDGSYKGSYSKGRFSYKVEVTVKDNRIESVKILSEPPVFSAQELDNTIISRVLQQQSLKVDAVTGATATSKALLKAIENALNK